MARNCNGGTDRLIFTGLPAATSPDLVSVALRFKTTQTTSNALLASRWTSSSNQGFGLLLNNGAANKLTMYALGGSQTLLATGTTTINGGGWISVVVNFNLTNGGTNQMYVNGASDASGNSTNNWFMNAADGFLIGDDRDAFWATFVGDYADLGYWHGTHLSADDIAAYQAGIGVRHIKPAYQKLDAPLYRDAVCRIRGAGSTITGMTASDHPRTYA